MWVFTATRDTGRIFGGSTATPRLWNHFPHFQGPSSISKFLPIRCSLRGLCKYFIEFSGKTGCGARWRLPLQIVSHAGLHENGETTRACLRPSGQVSSLACDMQLPSDGVVNVQHMRNTVTSRVSGVAPCSPLAWFYGENTRYPLFSGDGPRQFCI